MSKPIRIFYSDLARRFYAARAYKDIGGGVTVITGEKFDVTDEIAALIKHYRITFKRLSSGQPQ